MTRPTPADAMTRPAWSVVVLNAPSDEAEMFLETFKRYTVARSNAVPCTICMHVEPHLMRYRILECGSPACTRAFPGLTCSWRGRTLKCLKTDEISIFECSSHVSPVRDPRQESLTAAQKVYIREMSALRMKPAQIRNSMTRKFNLAVKDLPSLAKVQNFANYYKKKKLLNNDCYDDVVAYIREHAFTGAESETQNFCVWSAI
ncbi:hypothetical protein PHYSODRAFT_284396 [Phytophthora sojae]|uniref:Uncharacterized protein n=1 Tax=Phytophthora sojae (strain P6497) TaxID=1094619 RepID=G4YKU2_PHYSP|nr:hypothetical protein PHYSODRAFT_284396 [Phytophthora sojae]EGZ29246.1 hypothetical protein PHYSODRAFT_284396 [Phytophthora sojae]|eukprot:XP_009516521.1 hypothetical protein PHYSODRAFT_284396 [Phytophthora sojae]